MCRTTDASNPSSMSAPDWTHTTDLVGLHELTNAPGTVYITGEYIVSIALAFHCSLSFACRGGLIEASTLQNRSRVSGGQFSGGN